jgi:hypothetical protein
MDHIVENTGYPGIEFKRGDRWRYTLIEAVLGHV